MTEQVVNNNPQPQDLSPVDRFKSFLTPEPPPQASAPEQPEEAAEGEEFEEYEAETDEGQSDDQGEAEESGDLYTVKVDGKEKQVSLEELIKGYQLDAHYTQKSQKLAEEMKAVSEERQILNGVSQKFEQLGEVVTYLTEVNNYLESTLPPMPDITLADTNPAGYIKAKEQREQHLRSMAQIAQKVSAVKAQSAEIVQQMQVAGAKVIQQKMPELLEPQTISGLYSYLTEAYGYPKDVIDRNVDPNLFIMAEKARRWDEMQSLAVKPDYVKQKAFKPKTKPKVKMGQQTQQRAAMSEFKQKPNFQTAAKAFVASGLVK